MAHDMPAPPAGFDPESAEFHNMTPDRFTAVPKESHRRAGGERELKSITALGLLTIYLSNETGWKPPNAATLAEKYAEGPTQIRAAIAEIERAGYLVRYKLPNKRGHWVTHTVVSAHPETLDDVRAWAERLAAAQAASAAARRAAGITGGGRKAAEAAKAAGVTAAAGDDTAVFSQVGPDTPDRDSVRRTPVHRDSADRVSVQRDLKNQENNPGEQQERVLGDEDQKPPPTPRAAAPALDAPNAQTGGDFDEVLKTAALEAERIRDGARGWDWQRAYGVAERCVSNGAGRDLVAATLVEIAGDLAGTNHPGRLPHVLAEKSRATAAPRPSGGSGSIPANRERCRKHPTEIADTCSCCAGERNGGTDLDGEPVELPDDVAGLTGAALVLAMANRKRKAAAA